MTVARSIAVRDPEGIEGARHSVSLASVDRETGERFRLWVESETGMDFSDGRFDRLGRAVDKVLTRSEPPVPLGRLMSDPRQHGPFLERLTAELTVGESFFFRNPYHFQALREHVFPEILGEDARREEVRIWSAGCATGEEPYSLAILLDQLLGGRAGWRISILATDLNPEYLEKARAACYRAWSFRMTDIQHNRRYFTEEGEVCRLADDIRSQVHFAYLNLVKDVYPSPLTGTLGLDLILFRNVAIYLKPEVTRAILERFQRALRPGGWLLLGESELALAPDVGFEVQRFEQATFHRKSDRTRPRPAEEVLPLPPVLSLLPPVPAARPGMVPSLPRWSPLPAVRGRTAPPVVPPARGEPGSGSVWDLVQRALAAGRFEEADRAMDRLSSPRQRAQVRLRAVRMLLERAEVGRARSALDACLRDDPLSAEAQLLCAAFAEEAGDLDAAERAYRRALYADRQAALAHFHLAIVLQQRGDAAGAARSLNNVLQLIEGKATEAPVSYGEGMCCGRLREMVAAVTAGSPRVRPEGAEPRNHPTTNAPLTAQRSSP